jgi:hypothetical protein
VRLIMGVLFSASVFLCMSQIIIFLSSLLSQNLNAICCMFFLIMLLYTLLSWLLA